MKNLFLWVLMAGSSFWANAQTQIVLREYVVSQTTFFQLFFPSNTTSLEFKQNFQDEINFLSFTHPASAPYVNCK